MDRLEGVRPYSSRRPQVKPANAEKLSSPTEPEVNCLTQPESRNGAKHGFCRGWLTRVNFSCTISSNVAAFASSTVGWILSLGVGDQGILEEGRGYRDVVGGSGTIPSEQLLEGSADRLEVRVSTNINILRFFIALCLGVERRVSSWYPELCLPGSLEQATKVAQEFGHPGTTPSAKRICIPRHNRPHSNCASFYGVSITWPECNTFRGSCGS